MHVDATNISVANWVKSSLKPESENLLLIVIVYYFFSLLLLLVCVSFTIIGQPRNSVLIHRV